jgi:predicted Zn finger-like uncharacterized protein
MIEVQCTSCHTRYRIDEQVLPEGTPTFKCSRCGHVFSVDPRRPEDGPFEGPSRQGPQRVPRMRPEPRPSFREEEPTDEEPASEASSPAFPSRDPSEASHAVESSPRSEDFESQEDAAPPEAGAPEGPSTEDLVARSFEEGRRERREPKTGDNPSFEFTEEKDPGQLESDETPRSAAEWEPNRGRDFTGFEDAPSDETDKFLRSSPRPPQAEELVDAPAMPEVNDFMREEAAAPVYNQAVAHSARFLLLLCLIVGAGFGTMTFAIHNAPAGAADLLSRLPIVGDRFTPATTPARQVALRDVSASYTRTRSGQIALVITGTAENVSVRPLHVVEIAASLRGQGGPMAVSRSVYCGNNLSAKMLGQMTPHEVEFFQRLDPPKSFTLETSASCPFLLVFIDPPAGLNGFDISVARAIEAPADTTPPGA